MSKMEVKTDWHFQSPSNVVWPLLCNSKMDRANNIFFKFGVPQPLECRLPNGDGAVGNERECVSNKGIIHQRILIWEPGKRLSFRMERADFETLPGVVDIEDSFYMTSSEAGVNVTRTTTVRLEGPSVLLKKIKLFLGLKHVHRYVFRNWQRLVTQES